MSWESDYDNYIERIGTQRYEEPEPLYCDHCGEEIDGFDMEYTARIHGEVWCRKCIERAYEE